MTTQTINVIGTGIFGLWQAYQLSRDGFKVRLFEKHDVPLENSSSWIAGAMLAPYCEMESGDKHLIPLSLVSIALWRESPFDIIENGTIVVTPRRDRVELTAFAKRTEGFEKLQSREIAALEPDLAERFDEALYYKDEAHMAPQPTMKALLDACLASGVSLHCGFDGARTNADFGADFVVDARGMGAKPDLPKLRPVRGEMAILQLKELNLSRPVRLLHPRMPCYIVPWPDHHYMVGATVIESDDAGPVSVRSALELLGSAFSVHPSFGEAKIIEFCAGTRPSFPDNIPQISIDGQHIHVNGAYRHGFLLAPLLAQKVSSYIRDGKSDGALFA